MSPAPGGISGEAVRTLRSAPAPRGATRSGCLSWVRPLPPGKRRRGLGAPGGRAALCPGRASDGGSRVPAGVGPQTPPGLPGSRDTVRLQGAHVPVLKSESRSGLADSATPRPTQPGNSPGQNTGVGIPSLLQRLLPTRGRTQVSLFLGAEFIRSVLSPPEGLFRPCSNFVFPT